MKGGDVLPLPSSDGFLAGLRGSFQRRLSVRRVLIALGSEGFTCAWSNQGRWLWTSAQWPEGVCNQGYPDKPEAIADLIADLLLDLGLIGARVELLLPLELCEWRVVDGSSPDPGVFCDEALLRHLPWSLDPDDCYVSSSDCFGSLLAVGLSRSALQAWIDVFEQADLHLDRVDWLLSAAWRGALQQGSQHDSNLAWIIAHGQQKRLILLRHGVPEVDRVLVEQGAQLLTAVSDLVRVWQELNPINSPLQWLMTAPASERLPLSGLAGGGMEMSSTQAPDLLDHHPLDPLGDPHLLDPLVSLGLVGLGLSR